MERLRKIMLALGTCAFVVCSLFLDVMGGLGILFGADEKYHSIGVMLISSAAVFLPCLVLSYFRKAWSNIISVILNIAATVLYIIPLDTLNSIPESTIPRSLISVLTARIYPSIAVTALLGLAVAADAMSYDRRSARETRRRKRIHEKKRQLKEEEKII